ncbi:uncharacterized protein FA14DRAFT_190764 [Meira miltonrushii]|uniref:Zn(2)-C6 fungal-type domain-containing protein n=1 Tax=Meira miltonrushii TaxID=1280837 RepID=A0A316V9B4_9BASI|nr:uncharacterized protein FA14DRAFT_190764 [Meira miltonrushii]PWN33628.1 hypothetical protein FA14DRAFT_190764 [Meira miltonrushii]
MSSNNFRSSEAGPSSKRPGMHINLPKPPKRRKTPRACDYCREHKLRCDFSHELTTAEGQPVCKHCADFGIECNLSSPSERRRGSVLHLEGSSLSAPETSPSVLWQVDEREITDARYSGESSLSAIISQFIVMVGGREQQLRSVHRQLNADGVQPTGYDNFLLLPLIRYPPPAEPGEKKLIHAKLDRDTIRLLIDHYIEYLQPLNAVVTKNEVFQLVDLGQSETPITKLSGLALAVLGASAMFRGMPKFTRAALLFHLRQRRTAIFRTSLETVQMLIILSQNIELMAPDTNDAAGMSLNLTGLAVRMAHDLGLHRDLTSLGVPPAKLRKMARIWSALVIQDRWYALCYGQPSLIHLEDGDAAEPSQYDDEDEPRKIQANIHASGRPPNQTHIAHYRIALLVGRLHKIVFGPKGLRPSSFKEFRSIVEEINEWKATLPPALWFNLRSTQPPTVEAGFLYSLRVCMDFLIYRACLSLPPDQKNIQRPDVWSVLVRDSADALEWLASSDGLRCLDSYSIVMYFMIQCSIIHFYESSRGGSLHSLRVARQCLQNRGTVATQLASRRGNVYDPYGEQDQDSEEASTGGKRGNQSVSRNGRPGLQNTSPSPESAGGPPRLLRLRVKISALVSMLLEVAEHRRAAVLARNEQSDAQNHRRRIQQQSSESSHARYGNGNIYSSNDHNNASPNPANGRHPSQTPHARQHSAPSHHSSPTQNHPTVSSDGSSGSHQPRSDPAFHSKEHHMRMHGRMSEHDKQGQSPQQSMAIMPPGGVIYSTNQSEAGESVRGSLNDSSSMASLSPNNIEDLDLMTLQRWADALLRNPTSFEQQQHAINGRNFAV